VPREVKVASTHSYEVPNPYDYLTSVGHKRDAKQTSFSFLKSVKTFSTSWIGKITIYQNLFLIHLFHTQDIFFENKCLYLLYYY